MKTTADTISSHSPGVVDLPQTKVWDHGEESYKAPHLAGTLDQGTKPDRESGPPSTNTPCAETIHPFDAGTLRHMNKWKRIACWLLVFNIVATILLWPMPLYRDYIFGKELFSGCVEVSILWQFSAVLAVAIYPVWDGRAAIGSTIKGIIGDVKKSGRRGARA
jgi:hypothetical protein